MPDDTPEGTTFTRAVPGYSRFIYIEAKQYNTNAGNLLRMNFYLYQQYTILDYLKSIDIVKPSRALINELKVRINNLNHQESEDDVSIAEEDTYVNNQYQYVFEVRHRGDETNLFVDYHRQFFVKRNLENHAITPEWVDDRKNLKYLPLYMVHLLRYQERLQKRNPEMFVKLFHPLPINKTRASHIHIDPTCLYYILKMAGFQPNRMYQDYGGVRFPPFAVNDVSAMRGWWSKIFYTHVGESVTRRHYTSLGVVTNGVSSTFVYKQTINHELHHPLDCPPNQVEEESVDQDQDEDPPDGDDDPPDQDEVQLDQVGEQPDRGVPPDQVVELVGGLDPGVSSLFYLLLAVIPRTQEDMVDYFVPGYFEYSSVQHRHDCKIVCLENHLKWLQELNSLDDIYQLLSQKHFKTSKLACLYAAAALRTQPEIWTKLWRFAFNHKSLRLRHFVFGQKKSAFASQLRKIEDGKPTNSIIRSIGFGDGTFGSSYRGREGGAPTRQVKEVFSKAYNSTHVNEYRTSSVCPCCRHQLYNLYHCHGKKKFYIRGIKICMRDECRDHRLYHRDRTGAYNILLRHLIDEDLLSENLIPHFLQRAAPRVNWRQNNSFEKNYVKFTAPTCNLTRKQRIKYAKDKKKAQNRRNRVIKARRRNNNIN